MTDANEIQFDEQVVANYSDQLWRLCNLYWILDKDGNEIPFRPNDAQLSFLQNIHTQNVILKARQRGFSTVIQLLILDSAVFYPNTHAGVIAHTMDDVQIIFEDKIKFAYDRLPDAIRLAVSVVGDSKRELKLSNGSRVRVGVSMRSGTLQYLHVSEFGKICAKYPDKAKEIMTGSLPTVQAGNFWFIESTAEGREGYFFDMCNKSEARMQIDRELSEMEAKFHFYSWWDAEEYQIDPANVVITPKDHQYFDSIEQKINRKIELPRRAWYVMKRNELGGQESMYQEYPSTPTEAFQNSAEGTYYVNQLTDARKTGRICRIPKLMIPVNTFWDVGRTDLTAIWFHQQIGMEHRFIKYYENSGEDLAHYFKVLQDTGYIFNRHYLPHDADHHRLSIGNKSIKEMLEELGMKRVEIVPRIENITFGIEMVRKIFPACYFDEAECSQGLLRLENYPKAGNSRPGSWGDPLHDDNSNGADAFRGFAQAIDANLVAPAGSSSKPKPRTGSWRTV